MMRCSAAVGVRIEAGFASDPLRGVLQQHPSVEEPIAADCHLKAP
jgi:hypothetical protein